MTKDHDPTETSGQETRLAEKRHAEAVAAAQEVQDLRWLMKSRQGRRVAHRHLERLGVFQSSFNTNALTMAFNEGRRNEGLRFLGQLNAACPEEYITMLQEHKQ